MTRLNAISIVLVVALALAGTASYLVYRFLSNQENKKHEVLSVFIAARDIPVGTKLDATNIRLASWPKENLPQQGYFPHTSKLHGRVAIRQVSAGDIVTETKLMPLNRADMGGVMTYIVPQGHRAVTVAVNEVAGVAGFITPGSRVDVVLSTQITSGTNNTDDVSKIILQNVPVLASAQTTEQKDGKPTIVVPSVTLDLLPADAEKLIVGTKKGTLQLLLRNAIDTASVSTSGMTIAKTLNNMQVPDATRGIGVQALRALRVRRSLPQTPSPPPRPQPPPKVIMEIIEVSSKGMSSSIYKLR